jgi:NodT family efflux transporter outer membrane factor (OMF) lipoprotein
VRPSSAATLLGLMLAGCTAGPNYHVPDTAVANAPAAAGRFVNSVEPAFATEPLPDHWWRLYDDARLDAYVQEALAANADLRAADANLRRAAYAIRAAQSARTIATTIEGQAEQTRLGGIDGLDIAGSSYALGAGLTYPLDLAGGIKRSIEAARADAQSVEATRDQVRVTVAASVARNYVGICSANRSITAAEHVVAVQRTTLGAITRLFRGGRGTAFDVTRAQAAVDQSLATIPTIVAQRQAGLYAIAALMGRPTAYFPRELIDCPAPPAIRRPLPIGDGAALIRRRPDIRAAERSLAAATASIGIATAALYPQVSLGAAIGIAGPFSTFGNAESWGGNIGPAVSWSFPNQIAVRARISEAGAAAEAASAHFDGTVLTALQQTETALSAYAREIEHDRALARARDSAAKAVDQANRLFTFGRTDLLSLLTVQSNLATAETALAASQATLADDQVNVFLQLGGGWEDQPPIPSTAPHLKGALKDVPQLSPNSSR